MLGAYVPRNEDGEFELVLANRQLLSVFFIVVILLGVFFTMGYIVGRGSSPVATADATPPRRESKPLVVDSAAPSASQQTQPETPVETPRQPISTAPQQPVESVKSEPKLPPAAAKLEPRQRLPSRSLQNRNLPKPIARNPSRPKRLRP